MSENIAPSTEPDELRKRRLRQAAVLLRKWQDEETTYDEEVWNILERELVRDPIKFGYDDETTP